MRNNNSGKRCWPRSFALTTTMAKVALGGLRPARKLLLLLGKSVVIVSETQKRCRIRVRGHQSMLGFAIPQRGCAAFWLGQYDRQLRVIFARAVSWNRPRHNPRILVRAICPSRDSPKSYPQRARWACTTTSAAWRYSPRSAAPSPFGNHSAELFHESTGSVQI